MVNVLLLGCDGNAGMNYAKCLKMGDKDVRIFGTGHNKYHLKAAEQSGLFEVVYDFNEFRGGTEEYNSVRHLVYKEGIDFVHAQPEQEVEFLCKTQGMLPSFGKFMQARDLFANKKIIQGLAGQDVYDGTLDSAEFYSLGNDVWCRANTGSGSKYALPVTTYSQFLAWTAYLLQMGKIGSHSEMSLSKYLPGREFAVQMFFINGSLYHMQQRERIEHHFARQMISGQSSTPSVAKIENRSDVYQAALDIVLDAHDMIGVEPNGIYGVDIRCDANDDPHVTEVNYGRYFTTSDFFATYGVNTPYEELMWVVDGVAPSVKLGAIKDEIYWVRGLDHEPISYTKDELDG